MHPTLPHLSYTFPTDPPTSLLGAGVSVISVANLASTAPPPGAGVSAISVANLASTAPPPGAGVCDSGKHTPYFAS